MPQYTTAELLTDVNSNPIPQEYDPVNDKFVPSTKRNVDEIFLFDSKAITAIGSVFSPTVDVSKYKSLIFWAVNTHDVDMPITFQNNGNFLKYYDGTAYTNYEYDIAANQNANELYNLNTVVTGLDDLIGFTALQVRAKPTIAPTTGFLTVKMFGVIN